MEEFIKDIKYYFEGDLTFIENKLIHLKCLNNEFIFLGKFIEYTGFLQGSDWLYDAKAKFEFGTISKGYYGKIKPLH